MRTAVYGEDKYVIPWVAARTGETGFHDATSIGLTEKGVLIAGVVFNMYTGTGVCMHVAAKPGKRWLTKDFLFRAFAYPFIQLNCSRITGLVRVDNLDAQKFDEHLGFQKEGLLRKAATDGTDMILYGMLKEECKWLRIKK